MGTANRTITSGADVSVTSNIGNRAQVDLQYALVYARAYGLSPILMRDPDIHDGQLLPTIPVHGLNASVRYAASRSTTLLAAVNITGANNDKQRKSYSIVDLGVRLRATSGDFVAGLQNVFNTGPSQFGSFSPFPYLTQPIAPRTFSFRYRLALGQQNIDKTQPLSMPLVPNATTIVFQPVPFENAPAKALAAQTTSWLCGPEQIMSARPMLAAVGAYRDYIDRQLRDGNARGIVSKTAAGMSLSYIANGATYTIRIALPQGVEKAGPFLRCALLHFGDYATATQLHLYIPGWRERYNDSIFVLYYAPQAGLYFAPDGTDETSVNQTKQTPFPDARPIRDIHIDPASCPSTYRAAATSALSDLEQYIVAFYAGDHPAVPAGFRIASHASKNGPWLEIRADDFSFGDAFKTCIDTPVATEKQLRKHGISGGTSPSVNYAPGVGFYTTENTREIRL